MRPRANVRSRERECPMKRDTKAFWSAFGLAFESGMELPEMNQVTGVPADIEIAPGKVPRHVENAFYACPWYEAAENQFLIRVPGIASFHVENGNRIVAEGSDGASSEDVRVFLLNTVLPALLLQRGMVALHGAAAVINGQ